jgi:hypothetical protein
MSDATSTFSLEYKQGPGIIQTANLENKSITTGLDFATAEDLTAVPAPDGKVISPALLLSGFGGVLNKRVILTTSGTFTAPVTGWYRVTIIGAGGGGGRGGTSSVGGTGGLAGGASSFDGISALGGGGGGGGAKAGAGAGGGAGMITIVYLYLIAGQSYNAVVGAGGIGGNAATTTVAGSDGGGTYGGFGGLGVHSASSPGTGGASGAPGLSGIPSNLSGIGGIGGSNGTGHGSGGSGSNGTSSSSSSYINNTPTGAAPGASAGTPPISGTVTGNGGAGGKGAVILEFFDPNAALAA